MGSTSPSYREVACTGEAPAGRSCSVCVSHGHAVGGRGARLVRVARVTLVIVLAQFLPDARPFEVRLRQRLEGSPMSEDLVYTWTGYATDEAHAVVVAKREAAADGWAPEGPVAYRVVETGGFLPVAHEWVDRAS